MKYDEDKVDEMTLALLFLTLHDAGRAWKGHDWDATDRLHEKGMIEDPRVKAKSLVLTDEGLKRCEELFRKHFGLPERPPAAQTAIAEKPAQPGGSDGPPDRLSSNGTARKVVGRLCP